MLHPTQNSPHGVFADHRSADRQRSTGFQGHDSNRVVLWLTHGSRSEKRLILSTVGFHLSLGGEKTQCWREETVLDTPETRLVF